MTIKEFAQLCGCNPQTLRYYDHVGLLKPIEVNSMSGYRIYEKEQAITFVKIKNFQKAGFSIEEIKNLLVRSDAEIFYAFQRKIAEEEERIAGIREIQKSYQSEITDMINKVETYHQIMVKSMESYEPYQEFGLSPESYAKAIEKMDALIEEIMEDGDLYGFEFSENSEDEEDYFESCLTDPDYEIIFEKHGWQYVKDFYDQWPKMNDEDGYLLLFRVNSEKTNKTAFANTIISMCQIESPGKLKIGCTIIDSKDAQNHFWLVKYQDLM